MNWFKSNWFKARHFAANWFAGREVAEPARVISAAGNGYTALPQVWIDEQHHAKLSRDDILLLMAGSVAAHLMRD